MPHIPKSATETVLALFKRASKHTYASIGQIVDRPGRTVRAIISGDMSETLSHADLSNLLSAIADQQLALADIDKAIKVALRISPISANRVRN